MDRQTNIVSFEPLELMLQLKNGELDHGVCIHIEYSRWSVTSALLLVSTTHYLIRKSFCHAQTQLQLSWTELSLLSHYYHPATHPE